MRSVISAGSVRVLSAMVLLLFLDSTLVSAVGDQRPTGRFDHRVLSRVGGRISVEAETLDRLDSSDRLRRGWEEFSRSNGSGWRIFLDQRTGLPTLVSGRGIEWLIGGDLVGAGLPELESLARAFLTEHKALFGDGSETLELDLAASKKLRRGHWQLVFRQTVDGVRVENSRLDFHVNQGRLVLFGASLWGTPRISGLPAHDAAQARHELDDYLETSTAAYEQVGEPHLVMIAVNPDPTGDGSAAWTGPRGQGVDHALIWRFRFREPGRPALWVAEIDAHDGTIRAFYDGAHYSTIRGGVFPISNDGDCATGGCEVVGFPMPFADYTESGQPEEFADEFGNLQCGDPDASFETRLIGPYVRVDDACGLLVETGTCATGVDLGMKGGENCDFEPDASPGNSAAARSAYYHLNRIAEAARFYDPTNAWLNDSVTVNVNGSGTCNAFWNGEINMYGAGNGCGNTGEMQGVLVHEWGHGYDHNDGGGADVTSEAYADVVAIFAGRDSCVSRGWFNDGRTCTGYGDTCLTCTGIRDHDWAARERNTPTTPENFIITDCPSGGGGPCARESHCESYPISESIFDLATRDLPASGLDPDTAWQLAERLWYETRPGSGGNIYNCFRINLAHSCDATSWYQRMRVADDDDGDLSNGTPHAAALFAAFDRHDIACGNGTDPENQSTSGCPSLDAPQLTVAETPSGTELSWLTVPGADSFRVYRGDLGCDRQQVPIASLPGSQLTYLDTTADPGFPRYYRIEAFTANPACHSPVSNCTSTPGGARLQNHAHRVVEDVVNSDGDGSPDPGETLALPVSLLNGGIDVATGVSGRLRLLDPAQGRVVVPETTWPDLPPSADVESLDPHFGTTVFEDTSCGETLQFEYDSRAANDAMRTHTFQLQLGEPYREFLNDQSVSIPPETIEPVTSTLILDQDQAIAEIDVTVRINHNEISELTVDLMSPAATTVRLHDRSTLPGSGFNVRYDLQRDPDGPGSMADFVGESTQGTWTLSVEDLGPLSSGNGTLVEWTLHVTVQGGFDCQPWSCPEATPTDAVANLVVDTAVNGPDLDLVLSWDPLAAVAGYHVLQSTVAPFDAAAELTGKTAGATTLTVADGGNATPDLTFFQVRAVNACSQEGP